MTSMITEVPREKLKELIEKNGDSLLQDPDRCEGLLKDHCGAHRREISALVGALEERVPLELRSSWQTAMTPEAMRARLVQRLEENRGLAPEVATWAVDAWSYALGVGLGRSSDRVENGLAAGAVGLGAAGMAAEGATGGASGLSVADRVASDRTSSSLVAGDSLQAKNSSLAQIATPKKAGIGAVAALALAAGAFALWHHPTPPSPGPDKGGNTSPQGTNPSGGSTSGNGAAGTGSGANVAGGGKPSAGTGGGNVSGSSTSAALTLPVGTGIAVRLDRPVNSDDVNEGDILDATVSSPVTLDGNVVIATGARAHVRVTGIDRTGKAGGMEHMQLALVDVSSEQGRMEIASGAHQFDGPTAKADAAKRAGIGGAAGAVGGFVVGHLFHHGGAGAAAGGGTGAVAGASAVI